MSVWIADIDASVLTQSDGFTTGEGWDVTTREWYTCIETKKTILTENLMWILPPENDTKALCRQFMINLHQRLSAQQEWIFL